MGIYSLAYATVISGFIFGIALGIYKIKESKGD